MQVLCVTTLLFQTLIGQLFGQQSNNTVSDEIESQSHFCEFDHAMREGYEMHPEVRQELMLQSASLEILQQRNEACSRVITIPVVFHFIYNANNLSDGYRNDNYVTNVILDGMNSYFSQDDNVDNNLPPAFQGTAANGSCIEWCLATYDHPQNTNLHGNDINRDGTKDFNGDGLIDEGQFAINRITTSNSNLNNIENAGPGTNQHNLIQSIAPAWPVDEYLNVYILPSLLNSSGGTTTAGYTYLPGYSVNDPGYNSIYLSFPFANGSTTIAHECGHWLGLTHVWGGGCGSDDYYLGNGNYPVDDTYSQSSNTSVTGNNVNCSASSDSQVPQSCGSVDNIFNIMDYGPCTEYFTNEQANYMYLTVTQLTTSNRDNFDNDLNLIKCEAPSAPQAAFSPTNGNYNICHWESITFTDLSTNSPNSWSWTFTGSALNNTIYSDQQNPSLLPDQTGTITASLTVSNLQGSSSYGPYNISVYKMPEGTNGCPPVNNECFGAIDISSAFVCNNNTTVMGSYDNSNATSEPSDLSLTNYSNGLNASNGVCCLCESENNTDSEELHNTLWYYFVPSVSGNYLLEAIAQSSDKGCGGVLGNYEDSQMLIYQSNDGTCNDLSFFDCNEDGPSASSLLYPAGGSFYFNAGTSYYLIVDEYYVNGLETGTFCLEVSYQGSCSNNVGCTDQDACNYDPSANLDNGSCIFASFCDGNICTNGGSYYWDNNSCSCEIYQPTVNGCTDPAACNYNSNANCSDDSCDFNTDCLGNCNVNTVYGCTNSNACNYNPSAICNDGTCYFPDGCTDPTACNFDSSATCDDGSCEFASCQVGGLSTIIFYDVDSDGILESTDTLVQEASMEINGYGNDGIWGTNDDESFNLTSGDSGELEFYGLVPGSYLVNIEVPYPYAFTDGSIMKNYSVQVNGSTISQIGSGGKIPVGKLSDLCQSNFQFDLGWSIISANCIPHNSDLEYVFSSISNDIEQVKDLNNVFIPALGFNEIGDWDLESGYFVKANVATQLQLQGNGLVDPLANSIALDEGWNIVPYWLEGSIDPVDAFQGIEQNIIQVKTLDGVYIPQLNLNTIGLLENKMGYLIHMNAPDLLVFDPDLVTSDRPEDEEPIVLEPEFYQINKQIINPNNCTVIIMDPQNGQFSVGDEIAVFNDEGILCGSAVYQNQNIGLVVYGKELINEIEGMNFEESFVIKHWDKIGQKETLVELDFTQGVEYFTSNGFNIGSFKTNTGISNASSINFSARPNPASEFITFDLTNIEEYSSLDIRIYDLSGKLVSIVVDNVNLNPGNNQFKYDLSKFNPGIYLYEITIDQERKIVEKLFISK